ncbi:tetratricopeptide repeat protein [Leptotrichia buccalis]
MLKKNKLTLKYAIGYTILIILNIFYFILAITKPSILNGFLFILLFTALYVLFYFETTNLLLNRLEPKKYISRAKKISKILSGKNEKSVILINLSIAYLLLNEKEKFLECINAIKITQNTPKKIKYFYYYNLAAYKYFINEKNEAKKIFDENIRKKTEKTLLEIMLDYEDKPQEKIAELKKLKSKDKLTEIQVKFVLAKTYEKVQDFEKAKKIYEEVAEKGNKLYIVKVAQKKILELNLKIKN